MINIINGDLLSSTEKYIAHQCNCVTNFASGLAANIFKYFPYSDVYSTRNKKDDPGTIKICGDGISQRYVINIFAQVYPGKPKFPDSDYDGFIIREKYFHKCLAKIAKTPNLVSIAFPEGIGCGLAGGNWDHYLKMLEIFAKYVEEKQNAKVFIYRKINGN